MAGLLSEIFSAGNVAKRKLTDLLGNPLESAQQILGNMNDRARVLNEMTSAAAREGVTYGPASQQLGGLLSEAYNPVGMFIGPSSAMFNKDMAIKASQMAKKGKSPQEIWEVTGTVKGPDGQWRQEISDRTSTMKGSGDFGKTIMNAYERGSQKTGDQLYKTNVDDVLFHYELSKAYPELMQIETQMMPSSRTARGSLANTGEGQLLQVKENLSSNEARSTILHEIQHAIQEKEGFGVGGNVRDFAKMRQDAFDQIGILNSKMSELVKLMDNKSVGEQERAILKNQYDDLINKRSSLISMAQLDPMQAYGHLVGEAEARLTQRRMDLTPEERKKFFPFDYTGETGFGLDVKPQDLIYMTPGGSIIERGLLK